jgi:putative endonuclease
MQKDALGLKGEQAAARYLKRSGYRILDRRWKCLRGELDLIAQKGDEVVFVEVKTRTSTDFGGATAAVDWNKAVRLRAAAYNYLKIHNFYDKPFRIDVIAVTVTQEGRATLEHFLSAIEERC